MVLLNYLLVIYFLIILLFVISRIFTTAIFIAILALALLLMLLPLGAALAVGLRCFWFKGFEQVVGAWAVYFAVGAGLVFVLGTFWSPTFTLWGTVVHAEALHCCGSWETKRKSSGTWFFLWGSLLELLFRWWMVNFYLGVATPKSGALIGSRPTRSFHHFLPSFSQFLFSAYGFVFSDQNSNY